MEAEPKEPMEPMDIGSDGSESSDDLLRPLNPEVLALMSKENELKKELTQFDSQIDHRNQEKEEATNPVIKNRIQENIQELEETKAQKETEMGNVQEQLKNLRS